MQPLIDAAGTDISHWFDPVSKAVRTYIDPETEFEVPFTPMGNFLHCPRSEEHTSELQSLVNLVFRLLLEKKKITQTDTFTHLHIHTSRTY